jgi:hypothetical protein
MTGTFRVTFHEWQKFELIVPARTSADAIRITRTLRHSIGTEYPFVEIDGGTEYFEAYGPARHLSADDINGLRHGLQTMRNFAPLDDDPEDRKAIRLLAAGLRRTPRGGRR